MIAVAVVFEDAADVLERRMRVLFFYFQDFFIHQIFNKLAYNIYPICYILILLTY